MKRTRATRSTPERDKPDRSAARAPGNGAAGEGGPTYGAALDKSFRSVQMLMEAGNATALKAVERGVETAYSVIEEYMRLGRETAQRYGQRNGDNMSTSERGSGGGPGAWGPWGPMSPMVAPWMQMMRLWGETMWQFAPRAWSDTGMNPFMPAARSSTSVRVSSNAPVEVSVDLEPGFDRAKLSVDPLRHETDEDVPPIAAISVKFKKDRLRVRVTVPDDQPPGEYRGAINDDSGVRRGELRLEIEGGDSD